VAGVSGIPRDLKVTLLKGVKKAVRSNSAFHGTFRRRGHTYREGQAKKKMSGVEGSSRHTPPNPLGRKTDRKSSQNLDNKKSKLVGKVLNDNVEIEGQEVVKENMKYSLSGSMVILPNQRRDSLNPPLE